MERMSFQRKLEDSIISRSSVSELLSNLSPEEFEVLWGLTDPEASLEKIAANNSLTISQVNTIRLSVLRKADSFLK